MKTRISAAVVAAVLAGSVAAIAGNVALAEDRDGVEMAGPETADNVNPADVTREWMTRRQLRATVSKMPAGWSATEVMRRAAAEPFGDATDRARWARDAAHMPAGWPATEAMRQAAA